MCVVEGIVDVQIGGIAIAEIVASDVMRVNRISADRSQEKACENDTTS